MIRFISLLVLLVSCAIAADQDPVLPEKLKPHLLLKTHLGSKFHALTEKRNQKFEELNGKSSLLKWQTERREFFLKQLGAFPQRNPLNAKMVGELDGDGYRIEKVIFESRPNFHVTATLYLPKTKGPFPGILIPCGHSHNGKAAGQYQKAAILYAQNGMAALCYDPAGQGERYQILTAEKNEYFLDLGSRKLKVPHPAVQHMCTAEHTLMGTSSILLGENFAQYRIWDGMRAIDYLQSRDDILPDKIGCTGNSGGGTLTAYLMALDDRIVAGAPGSYLTTFSKLIETKGPQDGEQNIFGQIAFGLDEADYVMMRAPSPVLICGSSRDATFDIRGTREVFVQSNRFFSKLGFPEKVELNEADVPHGYYIQHREAVARFMHRWLLGSEKEIFEIPRSEWPDPVTDEFLRSLSEGVWTQEELYASPTGQVMQMENERSIFEINTEKLAALKPKRDAAWKAKSNSEKKTAIREVLGDLEIPDVEFEVVNSEKRDGFSAKKIVMRRENFIPLPALAYLPDGKISGRILLLNGDGKAADNSAKILAKSGKIVLSAELTGIGETAAGTDKRSWGKGRFGWDNFEIFMAYLMGDSFVRMRAEDTLAFAEYFDGNPCELIADGQAAIPALHAASLHPEMFSSVRVKNMIQSWAQVVENPDHWNQLVNAVHGALRVYDLPDLVKMTDAEIINFVEVGWRSDR